MTNKSLPKADTIKKDKVLNYCLEVLQKMPSDWLKLTTHRLDIYDENLAKTEFLEYFQKLFNANNSETSALKELPTAFDYIRLGHPLSCVLEWLIGKLHGLEPENVVSFSSKTIPILAILRKNLLEDKKTQILHKDELPSFFNPELLRHIYDYEFEVKKIENKLDISDFQGTTIFISEHHEFDSMNLSTSTDFNINIHPELGSIILANGNKNRSYISEIQHVRRRESIAMTPANCYAALNLLTKQTAIIQKENPKAKLAVLDSIKSITNTTTKPIVASSGLSMQYAIMMGLIHYARENYKGNAIKFVVPPNCYGGTNDQARRIAQCIENVEIVDLPVDGDNDMVNSVHKVLDDIAEQDAVPFIIAEIPTNPRVEVPSLKDLEEALTKERKTASGTIAIDPVFILDQTFCPNVHFLGKGNILSTVRAISYASGSKFPSGGKCTAGYCVANKKAEALIEKIETHLALCDNEATNLQYDILANQLPSMNQRIQDAYINTREFVNFIMLTLPEAKINFVSENLAAEGFTPSVFSLDLPTKGNSNEERESYKRTLNHNLINLMISEIPEESKYCVSYGQLKGCYWTIPATSTQGTTKEGDKDYIARVALSPDLNLELHKKVFRKFAESI